MNRDKHKSVHVEEVDAFLRGKADYITFKCKPTNYAVARNPYVIGTALATAWFNGWYNQQTASAKVMARAQVRP